MDSFEPDFKYMRTRTCEYLKSMLDGPDGDNFQIEARRAEEDAWILISRLNRPSEDKKVEHRCICGRNHLVTYSAKMSSPCVWKK